MRILRITLFVAILLGAMTIGLFSPARSSADFNSSNLIDDMTFNNTPSMSAPDIDAFLNARSSCISTNSGFSAVDPIGYNPTNGYLYGGNVSAGTVIAHAAQAYDLNPQVLLTTLQKEQSLVTSTNCSTNTISKAVGYACPDGGTSYSYTGLNLYTRNGTTFTDVSGICVNSSLKAGFTQQLIRAAWLLKFSQQRSLGNTGWAIIRGNWNNSDDLSSCYSGAMTEGLRKRCASDSTAVYYDGYTPIDGVSTLMGSGATAALYRYTPHFSGNRNFDTIFNQYFGSQYANDTFSAHPNGTLISYGGKIYLVDNNTRRWITNADVFSSYGYAWGAVKSASTGDTNLTAGTNIDTLAPGTIFKSDNTPVYVMSSENGSPVKQQVSLASFNSLGYSWGEVRYVSPSFVPAATASTILTSNQHPAGTLVADNASGKVYLLDQTTKRWILGPYAFDTNNFSWGSVKNATSQDLALANGASVDMRQGAMLLTGGIYLVDYDANGITKRPVGPWECFANRLHYTMGDLYSVPSASLPTRSNPTFTC